MVVEKLEIAARGLVGAAMALSAASAMVVCTGGLHVESYAVEPSGFAMQVRDFEHVEVTAKARVSKRVVASGERSEPPVEPMGADLPGVSDADVTLYVEDVESPVEPTTGGEGYVEPEQFRSDGRAMLGGSEFTWYSENVMPGGGLDALNSNGRHVDDSGLIRDGDGYIAVASPWGVDEVGTVVDTPLGPGKVYDVCEDDSYDVYCSW